MHISRLVLTQFRNYPHLDLPCDAPIVALTGPNGAGKTSVLDALHTLCLTRGFAADDVLVQHGTDFYLIQARWHPTAEAASELKMGWQAGRGKRISVGPNKLPRLRDWVGQQPVVALKPQDTDLLTGSADGRRKWLDRLLSQTDADYLEALVAYEHLLKQRNAFLKAVKEGQPFEGSLLEAFTAPMVQAGAVLLAKRQAFLAPFAAQLTASYLRLADGAEGPSLVYEARNLPTTWPSDPAAALSDTYRQQLPADRGAGHSTVGPHRDDIVLLLSSHPAKAYGSQGQQKTFLAALRFAEYAYLQALCQRPPILLLDDVFDKLDAERTARLTEWVTARIPGQVWVTDTSLQRLREAFGNSPSRPVLYLSVNHGRIQPASCPAS